MAAKKSTARKRTAARRKKAGARTPIARKPRRGGFWQRRAIDLAWFVAKQGEKHVATVTSRKDAAILRMTHEGCPKCHGNGQIFTRGKDGNFTGSKPCTAKPTKAKAGRMKVAVAARFGPDKSAGLVGWTCPCGKKEKPRFRDAKTATKALRAHEQKRHSGKSVGGAWYGQVPEQKTAPALTATPTSKTKAAA